MTHFQWIVCIRYLIVQIPFLVHVCSCMSIDVHVCYVIYIFGKIYGTHISIVRYRNFNLGTFQLRTVQYGESTVACMSSVACSTIACTHLRQCTCLLVYMFVAESAPYVLSTGLVVYV